MRNKRLSHPEVSLAHQESQGTNVDQRFKDLLEASSLGTPAARRIISSTPADVVDDVRSRQTEHNPPATQERLTAAQCQLVPAAARQAPQAATEQDTIVQPVLGRFVRRFGSVFRTRRNCRPQVICIVPAPSPADGRAHLAVRLGPGTPVNDCLRDQKATAVTDAGKQQKGRHRGGGKSRRMWLLIPATIMAETSMAYVTIEVLTAVRVLTIELAVLTVLVGAGLAGVLASRRLTRLLQLPVPAAVRLLEGALVGLVTALRYVRPRIHDGALSVAGGAMTVAGGIALAALITVLVLTGAETIVVQVRTLCVFFGTLRASWKHGPCVAAAGIPAWIRARVKVPSEQLQHFLAFPRQAGNALALASTMGRAGRPSPSPDHRRMTMVLGAAVTTACVLATGYIVTRSQPASGEPAAYATRIPDSPMTAVANQCVVKKTVTFPPNHYQLTDFAEANLNLVLSEIKTSRTTTGDININGYADTAEPSPASLELSTKRAQTVATFFAGHGVPAYRLLVNNNDEPPASQPLSRVIISIPITISGC